MWGSRVVFWGLGLLGVQVIPDGGFRSGFAGGSVCGGLQGGGGRVPYVGFWGGLLFDGMGHCRISSLFG